MGTRKVNVVDNRNTGSGWWRKRTLLQELLQLFFLNLGGYKPDEMEEQISRFATRARTRVWLRRTSVHQYGHPEQKAFYKHHSIRRSLLHMWMSKYGVDVDDVHAVKDILPAHLKEKYTLEISPATGADSRSHSSRIFSAATLMNGSEYIDWAR